jgi:ribosomal protein L31E
MKKILMTTLLLLTASGYTSQINVQALEACSLVENDLKRLMCYDKVIAGKKISQPIMKDEKDKSDNALKVVEKSQNKANEFGLEKSKQVAAKKLDEIRSTVVKITKNPRGQRTFTLSNDQIWKQKGSDSFTAKKGNEVVIIRGVFDSFRMKKSGY